MNIAYLEWVDDGKLGYSGDILFGMIGQLTADPSTWWYSVEGITLAMKRRAKTHGHVKSAKAARAAVLRAFRRFLDAAELEQL